SGPIVGTHPLFGPDPDGQTPLRCAICPDASASAEDTAALEKSFTDAGIIPFRSEAHEHDRAMACIQGLNFVTSICYFASLPGDLDLSSFATPSFNRRFESARKMLTEDSELFTSLFEANPYSAESVRRFKSFLNLAAAGELNLLSDKAAWWWWNKDIQSGEGP
ncbi:MAG: prephenate dehydrogenase/arogenate dehydrogenase family protein, partial [Desulfonatronovibrionaceae bacterium]